MQSATADPADAQTALDLDDPRPLRDLRLHLVDHGGVVEVRSGGYLLTAYPKTDPGLRNLAIVALTEANVRGYRVADLFGLSPVQISRIRADYRQHGSAGLAKKRGRPTLLDEAQIHQARRWAAQKVSKAEIARRLNVSRPTIVELLKQHGPLDTEPTLDTDHPWDSDQPADQASDTDQASDEATVDQPADEATVDQPADRADDPADEATVDQPADEATVDQPADRAGDTDQTDQAARRMKVMAGRSGVGRGRSRCPAGRSGPGMPGRCSPMRSPPGSAPTRS